MGLLTYTVNVGTRQNLGLPSRRWAGRTPSRQLRQKQWTPPDLNQRPQRSISTYSEKDYIIGDSTPSALRRIANLLTNGPSPKEAAKKTPAQETTDMESAYPLPTGPVELDASSGRFELDAQPLPRFELSSQEPMQRENTSSSPWGQEKGKGDRLQADEWLTAQVGGERVSGQAEDKNQTQKTKKLEDWNFF